MENVIQNLCRQAGFEPKVLYDGTSTDMPMHFIANGRAIMITPRSITAGVRQVVGSNDIIRNIPLINEYPNMQKRVGVAFKEGHYQSDAAQEFYERMREFYVQID